MEDKEFIDEDKECMTIAELIEELKKYPQDMRVAELGSPLEGICVHKIHYESTSGKFSDFDYIAFY